MCGICGIIDPKSHFSNDKRMDLLQRMNEALWHRGPDEAGTYHADHYSLGMRRLSIIDLAKGQQPIFNENNQIGVFFNGEIYNYPTLRDDLIKKGHQLKTNSDTEVLVHLYEEYGYEMLNQLKGMFAFCIFDKRTSQFFLARDRFGEKPLYYHYGHETLTFSSEVQSLLENKRIDRKLNYTALPYYFRTSLVPEPITLLEGVQSLLPGHYMIYDGHQLQVKRYFHLTYKTDYRIKTEEEAEELLRPLLIQAVKRQAISDVPLGAFLSGGVDSSTIVALLQKYSTQKIKTFTVRFDDPDYDESSMARKVADYCGTDHHEITVPNFDFDESLFWTIIDHVGLPFKDSSAIPTFLISQQIRKYVKVALSGDGGDELFGGYALFQWYQKIIGLKRIPKSIRSITNGMLGLAQQIPGLNNFSKIRQYKRAINTSLQAEEVIPISLNEMFLEDEVLQLYQSGESIFAEDYQRLKDYPKDAVNWSPLRKVMYYRAAYTLPANMLVKVDRMSMANSLEVRAPFLDPDLFDASVRLPDALLINDGIGKYIIRKIMASELPVELFQLPKKGFSIPLYKYQNSNFKSLARQLLLDNHPLQDLLSKQQMELIYQQGMQNNTNNAQLSVTRSAHRLWMMMQLIGWAKRFGVSL